MIQCDTICIAYNRSEVCYHLHNYLRLHVCGSCIPDPTIWDASFWSVKVQWHLRLFGKLDPGRARCLWVSFNKCSLMVLKRINHHRNYCFFRWTQGVPRRSRRAEKRQSVKHTELCAFFVVPGCKQDAGKVQAQSIHGWYTNSQFQTILYRS